MAGKRRRNGRQGRVTKTGKRHPLFPSRGGASTELVTTGEDFVVPTNRQRARAGDVPSGFGASLAEVRTGLPYDALEHLRASAALTQAQVAQLLGIPERTIARRKVDGRLTPAESDRVDRTARILKLAADVLESQDKARDWLQKPNRGLGGLTPLSMLDTDRGTRAVEEALMAIEYGMYG